MDEECWDDLEHQVFAEPEDLKAKAIAQATKLGDSAAVAALRSALYVGEQGQFSVRLPPNRLAGLRYGKGWIEHDRKLVSVECVVGDTKQGYSVKRPGIWEVWGSDGVIRKRCDKYKVCRVKSGDLFWVVAMAWPERK